MMIPTKLMHRSKKFFTEALWDINYKKLPWHKKIGVYVCRLFSIIGSGIAEHKVPVRSTALAYTTLLSIVPLLAVTFSIFKAFGGLEKSMGQIQAFVLKNLATGTGTVAVDYLNQFISSYHTGKMGLIGFIGLLVTVLMLLTTIEKTFNDIWGIPKKRSFIRRFTVYWSMITIGPVLLAVSLTLTSAMQSNALIHDILALSGAQQFLLSKTPILTTFALFTAMYLIMPNTKIKFRSALMGGIIGGALWELAKYGFAVYAAKAVIYTKIYGSFGMFPIFLIWIYYTWVVVLIGAEIAYADQNIDTYKVEKRSGKISQRLGLQVALTVMEVIANRFYKRQAPISAAQLAESLDVRPHIINRILFELCKHNFISELGDEDKTYIPASPMNKTQLLELIKKLEEDGNLFVSIKDSNEKRSVDSILRKLDEARLKALDHISFEDVISLEELTQTGHGDS